MERPPLSVDHDRWLQAQAWELAYWERDQRKAGLRGIVYKLARPLLGAVGSRRATGDDSNLWWRGQFDGYAFLPRELGDYIELGCGPYTNTRLILKGRTARRVVCSDPLADHYLRYRGRWLAEAVRKGLVEIDNHPIEALPFPPSTFDVVTLINVLDHVEDAPACLETSIRLLKPRGYFILGQDLSDLSMVGVYEWFDQGHPMRLTLDDVEPYLQEFQPLLHKVIGRSASRDPRLLTGELVFAGRKLD